VTINLISISLYLAHFKQELAWELEKVCISRTTRRGDRVPPKSMNTHLNGSGNARYIMSAEIDLSSAGLQGKPASGKSTLMKYIRMDLEKQRLSSSDDAPERVVIDFFYSD